jgi:phage terminase large subunit-like protein
MNGFATPDLLPLRQLTPETQAALLDPRTRSQALKIHQYNRMEYLFPEEGALNRHLYRKHSQFFQAGAVRRCRAFLAGNKVGKTTSGAYEMALHLTGRYPRWWPGKRFAGPVKAWSCGLNNVKVRDSLQAEMCGLIVRDPKAAADEIVGLGTGMLPLDCILGKPRPKAGVTDAFDTVHVRHASGGVSVLLFKSYDAGVDSFSAENLDVIHLDEECPQDIWTECLLRTMTRNGIMYLTATPLLGMTEVCVSLMQAYETQGPLHEHSSATYVTMASWDDAPHLTEQAKKDLEKEIPAYQRDARMRGIPQLGAGAIYPIEESAIKEDPQEIPDFWPRSWAMDVGNNTAVLWGAHDRASGVYHIYREYFRSGDVEAVPPSIHAAAIKGFKDKDKWMPGVIDPAARGRSQTDGNNLLQMYTDLGLDVTPSQNAVESGIQEVLDAFSTGKLKISATCQTFWSEFRLYQRDKNGKVKKTRDHCMDALRYFWLSGRDIMRTRPAPQGTGQSGAAGTPGSWMA